MKKTLLYAAIALLLGSCGGKTTPLEEQVTLYPVCVEEGGRWSMVDANGAYVYENDFKNTPSAVLNGVFSVLEDDGVSVYRADDKARCILSGLSNAGYANEGLIAVVKHEGRISYADLEGNIKFTLDPIKGHEVTFASKRISDGLIVICTDEDLYGAVDKSGEVVIEPRYNLLTNFSEGLAIATTVKNDKSTYTIIDKKGNTKATIDKNVVPAGVFENGTALGFKQSDDDNIWGLIATDGSFTKIPGKISSILWHSPKAVIYMTEDGSYGIVSPEGETLVRAKYNAIEPVKGGETFLCYSEDSYDLVDLTGNIIKRFDYPHMVVLGGKDFGFIAKDGKTYVLLDAEGKRVGRADFEWFNTSYDLEGPDMIMSDYIDMDKLVNEICSKITPEGINGFNIGQTAKTIFKDKNPADYLGKNVITEELFDNRILGSASFEAYFTGLVATRYEAFDINNFDGVIKTEFTNATVREAAIVLNNESNKNDRIIKALVKKLESKGFKVVSSNDAETILSADKTKIKVVDADVFAIAISMIAK